MKKTTSLIMVLVLILSMLWGCGQADGTVVTVDSSGKGKTTLHFFANKWEENNVRVMEELITEFMKENKDIKVVYESMKGTEYYEVLKKRMLSGNGDDVFMVNHDTGRILKEKDLLVNLADSPVDIPVWGYYQRSDNRFIRQSVHASHVCFHVGTILQYGSSGGKQYTVPENLMQLQASCHAFFAKGSLRC